jgi:hypothetical protein
MVSRRKEWTPRSNIPTASTTTVRSYQMGSSQGEGRLEKGVDQGKTRPPASTLATGSRSQMPTIIQRAQQAAFGSTHPDADRKNRITPIPKQDSSGRYRRMPLWHGARNGLPCTNELRQVRRLADNHLGWQRAYTAKPPRISCGSEAGAAQRQFYGRDWAPAGTQPG